MSAAAYADSEVYPAPTRRPHSTEIVMIVHYSIAAELARQRQQHLARSFDSCRRPPSSRRRWWEPGFLRHPTAAREMPSPAQGRVPVPA